MEKMKLNELSKRKNWKEAVIVFREDSFDKKFSLESRSYKISSDAKYFNNDMIGRSLFGEALDGSDSGVRLDYYMHDVELKWKIDYCYILK